MDRLDLAQPHPCVLKLERRELLIAGAMLSILPDAARAAPASRSAAFDFLHGRWAVTHRKLKRRLAGSTDWLEFPGTLEVAPILGGFGNFDRNVLDDPAGRYEASSLRLYNPGEKHWSIWWLDSRSTGTIDPPVVGGFDGAMGRFFSDDSFEGRAIKVRTTYRPVDAARAEWTQAFSPDGGATWEVNWVMNFRRDA